MIQMMEIIEQFNQLAVREELSAKAILLWQQLCFFMNRRGTFVDVPQQTGVLMNAVQISCPGFHKIRQQLVDKGCLAVKTDDDQKAYYTLMLDGKVVGEKGEKKVETREPKVEVGNTAGGRGVAAPARGRDLAVEGVLMQKSAPSGDIMLTNRYRQYIDAFCDHFGPAPKADLLQWADMRVKNGWTLTLMGLEAVLRNLVQLSAGNAVQMGKIVAQSVKRRWKGFFALKVQAKPSGEKLLKQEQREERRQERKQQNRYGSPFQQRVTQKFAPEGRDLSFLVV